MEYKVFDESFVGFAYHKIVLDQSGAPCDYVFLEINPAFEKMTGLVSERVIGKRVTEVLPGIREEGIDFIQLYGKVALGGGKTEFDQYVSELDRHYKIIAFSPQRMYFWVNVLDITQERRQLEQYGQLLRSFRENEAQFQAVIETLPIAITIEDTMGKLLYINDRGLELFDFTEEIYGQYHAVQTLFGNMDQNDAIASELLHGTLREYETCFTTSEGRKVFCISQGMLIRYKGRNCFLGTHHDISERKQAEVALTRSEKAYRLLFDNAAEGIVIVKGGRIMLSNHMVEKLTGYTKEELEGIDAWTLVDERDREAVKAIQPQKTEEAVGPHSIRFRMRTRGNDIRWVEMKSVETDWDDERALLNLFYDVTTQMEAEARLKASEELFRLMFENAAEAIFVIQDNVVKIGNTVICRYTGYQREEIIGASFENFIYSEDREKCVASHYMRLSGMRASEDRLEFRLICKSGDVLWVQSRGVRMQWEGRDAIQYFVVDIDARVKAAEALRASEEKYRLIAEFVSDVIWVFNVTEYCLTYFSPAVEQLFGYTPEEALALPIERLVSKKSFGQLMEKINALAGTYLETPGSQSSFLLEVELVRKDGGVTWAETSGRFRENGSHGIEIIGVMRDIGERKKAEEQILYLSYHDQLTGLYNRRFYDEQLARFQLEKRYPLTLVLADVNGLKLTNDVFGHQEGDKLLIRVAKVFKSMCRAQDITARIGGDEFVILLPNTGGKAAERLVRCIREGLYGQQADGGSILSVSFGWATKERGEQNISAVFLEAENRMYLRKLTESVSMRNETVKLITTSLYRDHPEESQHSLQVSALCAELARALDMDDNQISELTAAGLLHDIGKIGIDDALLNKSGELSEKERGALRLHAEKGYHILKETKEFLGLANYVLSHHERVDGKGYPRGLSGEEIPVQSRIISIAEAYDAMTNARAYRPGVTTQQAVREIRRNAGTQFDAALARTFVEKVLGAVWEM